MDTFDFESFANGDRLSWTIAHHLTNTVTVLYRSDGTILDAIPSMHDNLFESCIPSLHRVVVEHMNIYELFEREHQPAFTLFDAMPQDQSLLTARPGVLDFHGKIDAFYSQLPLVMMRRFSISGGRCIGLIRLSRFFTDILYESRLHPLCCVDETGSLLGYNRHFFSIAVPGGLS